MNKQRYIINIVVGFSREIEDLREDLICIFKQGLLTHCTFNTNLEYHYDLVDDMQQYAFPIKLKANTPLGKVNIEILDNSTFLLEPIEIKAPLNAYLLLALSFLKDFAIYKVTASSSKN